MKRADRAAAPAASNTDEILRAYRVRQQTQQSADFLRATLEDLYRKPLAEIQGLLNESIRNLRMQLVSADPFDLLAIMSFLFLTSVADSRKDSKFDEGELSQAHIEYLHAMLLTIPEEHFQFSGVGEDARVDTVVSLLDDVFLSHSIRDQRRLQEKVGDELHLELAMHSLRTITQYLRNWGFPEQMKRVLQELLAPLDLEIESRLGLKGTALVEMLFRLFSLVEDRLDEHFRKLAFVTKGVSRSDIVSRYHETFNHLVGSAEETIKFIESVDMPIESLKSMILAHSGLRYRSLFTVTEEDISSLAGGSEYKNALIQFVDQSALSLGDLTDTQPEGFFLDNPVWKAPFIRLAGGSYFIPIVGSLVSFSMSLVERFIAQDAKLSKSYQKRRSKYLEGAVVAQLSKTFDSGQIHTGSTWGPPEYADQGENDIVVCSGDIALIVEAKSSALPLRDLRGGPQSAKSSLKKITVDATRQGIRFGELLLNGQGLLEFSTLSGGINKINASSIQTSLYYNVSLSLHPLLGVRSQVLQKAKLIPNGLTLTPLASLAELELIIDTLGDGLQFLHYVRVRTMIESLEGLVADELDIFAYYLQGCPRIDELSSGQALGFLAGMSKIVDVAYATENDLTSVDWQRTRRTPLLVTLLNQLRDNRTTGAELTALDLMSIPYSVQKIISDRLWKLEKTIWRHSGSRVRRCIEYDVFSWEISVKFILVASRGMSLADDMEYAIEQKRKCSPSSVIVIVSNPELGVEPTVLCTNNGYRLVTLDRIR